MNNPQEVLDDIEHKLFDIPVEKFVEVVGLLEQINDHPRVLEAMSAVRPRLVRIRPRRRPTLQRLFCEPFEDFFDNGDPSAGVNPTIERSTVAPLWRMIQQAADPGQMAGLRARIAQAGKSDDVQTAERTRQEVGRALWALSADVLRRSLADGGRSLPALLSDPATGPGRRDQVRDAIAFLDAGPAIAIVKNRLAPKPVEGLSDADRLMLREQAESLSLTAPHLVLHLFLAAAARLRHPTDLVTSLGEQDYGLGREARAALTTALSERLLVGLEARTRAGGETLTRSMDPAAAIALAERLVEDLGSSREMLDRLGHKRHEDRLGAMREHLRQIVGTNVLATARDKIGKPLARTIGADAVDPEQLEAAEDHARALYRCREVARALDLEPKLGGVVGEIVSGLDRRMNQLINSAIDARGDEGADIESGIAHALRLRELLLGYASSDTRLEEALSALQILDEDRT